MNEATIDDDYTRVCKTRRFIGIVASNFDHAIDAGIEDQLRTDETTYAEHTAWNFHGIVWYEAGKCFEAVCRYHVYQRTFEGPDVRAVSDSASEMFGHD